MCLLYTELEHPILYPECPDIKKPQRVLWKNKQNHLYWIAMRMSHIHRRYFEWGSSKVKKTFFCESPFAAFPGGRRTYEGWHDGKPSSWIKNVVFGVYFPFDIIGRIPAWPRKMTIMGINYFPRAYRTEDVVFVHCLLNWMLITNIHPTHPTFKALKKPCGQSA